MLNAWSTCKEASRLYMTSGKGKGKCDLNHIFRHMQSTGKIGCSEEIESGEMENA
jgi:hypothetical protein